MYESPTSYGVPMRLTEADLALPESALERQIADFLALDEWTVRHLELNYSERKRKSVGEPGMPDLLCIRYHAKPHWANLLWIECKTPKGRYRLEQKAWALRERRWGATVLHMGIDFDASIDGFMAWYQQSGLQCRQVMLGGQTNTTRRMYEEGRSYPS